MMTRMMIVIQLNSACMGWLVILGDVADADFLLLSLLFFSGDETLSSSILLNVGAGMLLGGHVEFSGVKILLKVS